MEEHVRALLARHGVPVEEYGRGGALRMADLVREVSEGLSDLEEDEAGSLVRHLSIVEVSLIAPHALGRLVLMGEEQILDDGRRRPPGRQKLHGKLRRGEAPVVGAHRAVVDRLGLEGPAAAAAEALPAAAVAAAGGGSAGTGEAVCGAEPAEVVEAVSKSFPGLRTRYAVHRVELRLPLTMGGGSGREDSAGHEALLLELKCLSGRPFMTVEGQLGAGGGGRVHLWRWEAEQARRFSDVTSEATTLEELDGVDDAEETGEDEVCPEEATPLEQAHRDLAAALRVIDGQKVALYDGAGTRDAELGFAQERLRRALKRISNLEGAVHFDARQLFGGHTPRKNRRMSKSLRHFIRNNFTDLSIESDIVASRRPPSPPKTRAPVEDAEEGMASSTGSLQLVYEVVDKINVEVEELRRTGGDQSWVLDTLALSERTGRRALLAMAELLVVKHATELGTTEGTMRRFTKALHQKYEEHPNPFHNEAHASVVAHSTHWLAVRGRAWGGQSAWLQIATDVAALAHDVGHFGRNNLFCANKGIDIALLYNDRSILENMHAATCFQLMQGTGCNILRGCSREKHRLFREHVVDLILATDMSSHFDFLGRFRVRAAAPEFCPQENAEDRRLVTRCLLKAADLGHAALPWEMHESWAMRLLTEFYEQGDEERALGLPVSPMCERSGNVAEFRESQKGFLQFVISPLYKEVASVTLPEVGETCITRLEVNAEDWVKREPSKELVDIVEDPQKSAASLRQRSSRPKKEVRICSPERTPCSTTSEETPRRSKEAARRDGPP